MTRIRICLDYIYIYIQYGEVDRKSSLAIRTKKSRRRNFTSYYSYYLVHMSAS